MQIIKIGSFYGRVGYASIFSEQVEILFLTSMKESVKQTVYGLLRFSKAALLWL